MDARSPGAPLQLLVSIDTEGDHLWSRPRVPTTENARYAPRFQQLCERYGLTPTWLVNWEMAHAPPLVELARDVLARGAGEVGMHLHAWNSPPLVPLTGDDARWQPYLVEYDEATLRAKVRAMTDVLEATFERKMVVHRAGRWALDARYARALVEHGYRVDTSVTPHVSWASSPGAPNGRGGTDYTSFPDTPYFLDVDGGPIDRPGASPLLEVPMTVAPRSMRLGVDHVPRARRALARWPVWLRPRRRNVGDMMWLMERALREGRPYAQLMIHSSELMPGGSPTFPDARAVDAMYADVERVLDAFRGRYTGSTFEKFRAGLPAIQDRV